jgi:hypothetical protein
MSGGSLTLGRAVSCQTADRRWLHGASLAAQHDGDAQPIINSLAARVPEHTLSPPVPIVATIRWAVDGEEHIDTVALGWTGQAVYVRLVDRRHQTNAIWLDGADVRRR